MWLVGDIGGTHSRFALTGGTHLHDIGRYLNADWPAIADLLREYRTGCPEPVQGAILAVAAPLPAGVTQATLTNLDWTLDIAALSVQLGAPVTLINDFQAVASGIDALGPMDLHGLQAGRPQADAPRLVLGAGTGLGVSLLLRQAGRSVAIATEGGHAGFAPQDAEQDALLCALREQFRGRVSNERLLSGDGLAAIYRSLHVREGGERRDVTLAAPDSGAAVTHAAMAEGDTLARAAVSMFARIYGSVAGDLALAANAEGGVYVAGGIAPRILPVLDAGGFIAAFNDKGRMRALVEKIPVQVLLNAEVGLLGAMQAIPARKTA